MENITTYPKVKLRYDVNAGTGRFYFPAGSIFYIIAQDDLFTLENEEGDKLFWIEEFEIERLS